MSETSMAISTFLNADMHRSEVLDIASGEAAVQSTRCPGAERANQDSAAVVQVGDDSGVLIVADGVGGARDGDKASRLAVEHLVKCIEKSIKMGETLRSGILDGFESANNAILDKLSGAATTLAVLEIRGSTVRPYHVGDSMIITMGLRGKLKFQTTPHSPVGYALESGLLQEEDALTHDERHVVSNVIGSSDMHIALGPEIELSSHDTVIVCSDGLFDNLMLSEIIDTGRKGPLQEASDALASLSQQRMSGDSGHQLCKPDDMTVIAFRPRKRETSQAKCA